MGLGFLFFEGGWGLGVWGFGVSGLGLRSKQLSRGFNLGRFGGLGGV